VEKNNRSRQGTRWKWPTSSDVVMLSPYSSRHGLALLVIAIVFSLNLQIAITKSFQESEACQTVTSTGTMGTVSALTKKNVTGINTASLPLLSLDPSTLDVLQDLRQKYKHQPTFLQAVEAMAQSVADLLEQDPFYRRAFAVMTEPERTISFRVPWLDDHGLMQYNRGWRVEFSRYVVAAVASV
jgi:uncharacterized protein YoxC